MAFLLDSIFPDTPRGLERHMPQLTLILVEGLKRPSDVRVSQMRRSLN